jgi:serine/threonine protein kinase
VTTSPSQPPEETRVGPYRLLAPIGEGGMGVVHLAQGPDGRRVALKVLRPHIVGDVEARERLAREVSSLQRITSPRIAEILDADPHGPVPYVVTRYVPGLSLYHHVAEEGPVEGRDLLHFAGSLAQALLAVHSVGVLHRDVKPTNVLMEGRSPVLIDFGLARVAEDPRLTQTGWLLGTPGYLAPEILYGDDATVASDVHAWGATVVFAATGRPPYGTGPVMAIMDRVRRGEHDLSGVPAPLRDLLRDALSAEPLERPSVHELLDWVEDERRRSEPAPATLLAAGIGALGLMERRRRRSGSSSRHPV